MRFPRPALVALLLALSTAGLVAQGVIMGRPGRIGPRDNVAPKTGTSRLRGRVVGGESGQPLRRAVVMLSGQELGEGRVASTDEEGRWELKDLPAGRYQLHASKGGFVPARLRPASSVRTGPANRARRGADPRERQLQLAARLGDYRTDRRRIRRADRRGHGLGDAIPVHERPAPDDSRGTLRADRRHRQLPPLRSRARRLLRQRDDAADGNDGDERRRGQHELRADVLPGHRQRAAGRGDQRRAGRRDVGHHLRPSAGAHGEGQRHGGRLLAASRWRAPS